MGVREWCSSLWHSTHHSQKGQGRAKRLVESGGWGSARAVLVEMWDWMGSRVLLSMFAFVTLFRG